MKNLPMDEKHEGELMDDESAKDEKFSLQVHKLWGKNTLLNVKVFKPGTKRITVGEQEDVDFFIPDDLLPDENFPVARVVDDRLMLSFPSFASGEFLSSDGTVTDLQDMRTSPMAANDPDHHGCTMVPLDPGCLASIYFGKLGLKFRHVTKPTGYISSLTDHVDYIFLNSLLLMFFLLSALVATFHFRPKSLETSSQELNRVPDRFVQMVLMRPKAQKRDLSFLARLRSDIVTKKLDLAAGHRGPEGKMGLKGRPDTQKHSAVRAIEPDNKETISNRGLIAAFGPAGTQGLSIMTDGTGLGGELQGAIGNLTGTQAGNSGGFGGLGLKGTGNGGNGRAETIGDGEINTHGRAGGQYRYGAGVSRIRTHSERNVDISLGVVTMIGPLSMETIRRVIHSHRDQIKYCYSQELTRHPKLAGKVSIKFTINSSGYVQQSAVSATSLHNSQVERCIMGRIRTWKFPKPRGGGVVIVNYPFLFKTQ